MYLVIDTNILVGHLLIGHLLREKGQHLLTNNEFVLFISMRVFQETVHEIEKRLRIMLGKGKITEKDLKIRHKKALVILNEIITVVPLEKYNIYKKEAKIRMHKDIDDWETVALALYLELPIWTEDKDFFGCGIATWSTETLVKYLNINF